MPLRERGVFIPKEEREMGQMMENGKGKVAMGVGAGLGLKDAGRFFGIWQVEKFDAKVDRNVPGQLEEFWREVRSGRLKPYQILETANVLLQTGMLEMWDLIKGASALHFNATDTKIGIGNDATAADPAQTDLIGASKTYIAMDSGWPKTRTDDGALGYGVFQTKATFGTGDANYAWAEAVVKNTNAGSLKCICRAATGWGTKTSAATWVATHTITLS
jgi:hypothetical protein